MTTDIKEKNEVLDEEIKQLTPFEHVRLRNEMYFGSRDPNTQTVITYEGDVASPVETTWVPAVFVAFREILDNALDEVVGHGHGNRIDVDYDEKTRVFSIKDNGRGVPITFNTEHQKYTATMAFSDLMTGRNFGERGEVGGTNGIGGSGVNFCSEFFEVEIIRDGKKFTQRFEDGGNELIINDPKIVDSASKTTGTKVTFKLSDKVYKDLTLPMTFLADRLYEVALCNPKLRLYFQGALVKPKGLDKGLFGKVKPITSSINVDGFKSEFLLIPDFHENGEYHNTLVNNIPAFDGGVHLDAFRRNFFSGLINALTRESRRRKLTPNRSDIADGILIYSITRMTAPNFNSQAKTRLNNEETAKHVRDMLDDPDYFKNIIKKYPEWINSIYERCAARTMKKDASVADREARKMMREKVPGLMDANHKDRSKCVLFLAEGLSALSSLSTVRDPALHGGLALSGKPLNVNGESVNRVITNEVLRSVMSAIGLVPGKEMAIEDLRYGKVYIAADSDQDGFNITALLVNFFYSYWPELFEGEDTVFNVFMTPFIIARKGKETKYWYSDDHQDFDPDQYKGWSITRAKGLGSLEEIDWRNSVDNPKLYPIKATDTLGETLDLIFNTKRADDRKEWMGDVTQTVEQIEDLRSIAADEYINSISKEYALYVCTNRAIPSVTDGLKDSQRKALWIMRNKGDKIKTISLAGEMISSGLYLHGDVSAADAAAKLAAPYLNNVTLLEGIGAFGTRVAPVDGIAAPRYTYVKKNRATEELIYPDLDIVPLKDNYDGSTKEPVTFLPIIPTVLLNGSEGIAVGWSTSILPHNLQDIVRETKNAIRGKKVSEISPSYDYLEVETKVLGEQRFSFSGIVKKDNTTTCTISELPPGLSLEAYKKRLNALEEDGTIVTYIDNSAKSIDIKVSFKRADLAKLSEEKLIDVLKLNQRTSERIVTLDFNGGIRVYDSTADLITKFVEWRKGWYVTRFEKIKKDTDYELLYWQGVKECFVKKLPSKLNTMKSKSDLIDAIAKITKNLDLKQQTTISEFASYRWAKDYEAVVDRRIADLTKLAADTDKLLKSQSERDKIYIKELDDLLKAVK